MPVTKPDNAEQVAQKAYEIFRGMKIDKTDTPLWEDLSRSQRGLLEWVVRYALMSEAGR